MLVLLIIVAITVVYIQSIATLFVHNNYCFEHCLTTSEHSGTLPVFFSYCIIIIIITVINCSQAQTNSAVYGNTITMFKLLSRTSNQCTRFQRHMHARMYMIVSGRIWYHVQESIMYSWQSSQGVRHHSIGFVSSPSYIHLPLNI